MGWFSGLFPRVLYCCLLGGLLLTACSPLADEQKVNRDGAPTSLFAPDGESEPIALQVTPTLDFPHPIPTLRQETLEIVIQKGDTLKSIARRYQVSIQQLMEVNQIRDPNLLTVGKALRIPPSQPQGDGPEFKIIPDSELVYGPIAAGFDLHAFIQHQKGYLANYSEEVDGEILSGAALVERVAREHSVNPRLLLAILEYMSGWVSDPHPSPSKIQHPLGLAVRGWEGLWKPLNFVANELNRGYYLWKIHAIACWVLRDGTVIAVSPYLNAGTAGVQHLYAELADREEWFLAVSENGLYAAYLALFGNPFEVAYEPLIADDLQQPVLQLPFEKGVAWYFTGGPHSGWGSGSAWAALDFAPLLEVLGCTPSQDWIVAAADGRVVYADHGMVIQDLDDDGFWQTGWSLLYLHVESRDRVAAGTFLKAGQRIGHPSCEGGTANGTHVHIARRYNGEWIAADGDLPFNLDGWISAGEGIPYDGSLTKSGRVIIAEDQAAPENMLYR